jgi:ribosomal protein S6
MKNFSLFLKDFEKGIINQHNPNVNTPTQHRRVLQYKIANLRKGVYQPYRQKFRKNRLYQPKRYLQRISNKIKEEYEKLHFSFKNFINEARGDEIIATHMGKKLISTHHSNQRDSERDVEKDHVLHAFQKGVEHVKANGAKFGKIDTVMVTSKKNNRSVIFGIHPDKYATNDKSSHFTHITSLPIGNHRPNLGTKKIMVEGIELEYTIIEIE